MVPRLVAYGGISTVLAGAVIYNVAVTRPNFFAATASLGHSKGSLMVLANFALWVGVCGSLGFKRLFFGELRQVESDHVFERMWIFLTESLLALTTFRDDFSVRFGLLYCALVFLKCFHWIAADRVDYIDQVPPPGPRLQFHVRLLSAMAILLTFDVLFFSYAMEIITFSGVSGMVLFASEFAILTSAMLGTFARYGVHIADLHRARGRADAPAWEAKSMYMFYIDLAADFLKLFIYLIFFIVIFINYGLPLQILRDVYMTLRSFVTRGAELLRYRKATRNMDELYPDATEEELERQGDRTCIICREEMIAREVAPPATEGPNETPKKLACGHVFHFHCLRSWLERQQICPTCRRDVLRPDAVPTQRNRNPVPAPQPAAAAQAANVAAEAARQAGQAAQANILPEGDAARRRMYEEYFRLPAINGDAPIPMNPPQAAPAQAPTQGAAPPGPTQAPGAPIQAGSSASQQQPGNAQGVSAQTESEDQRVQRSIWGAPITPGRFFPPALGAAPTGTWWEGQAAAPLPRPQSAASDNEIVSGTTTPAASRAPVVFTAPGFSRANFTRQPAPAPQATTEEETLSEDIIEDDGEWPADDGSARKAAAEAALRRFGGDSKGKRKATADPDAFDAPVTKRAVLTPLPVPSPHPQTDQIQLAQAHISQLAQLGPDVPRTPEAARAALDTRLRALRDVDNVLWGLVGELSKLKSAWEVEDEMAREGEQKAPAMAQPAILDVRSAGQTSASGDAAHEDRQ